MIIYVDSNYHCHVSNPNGEYQEFNVPYFDGKCDIFIEGYKFIPLDENEKTICEMPGDEGQIIPIEGKDIGIIFQAQKDYENGMRFAALEEENNMLLECILEMSSIVYA